MLARSFLGLAGDVRQLVVPVEVHLEGCPVQISSLEQFLGDVGFPRRRQQRDEPIVVADDPVQNGARRDMSWPTHHGRNPVRAFPVRVLLVAEGRHARVGPTVHVRAVVRRVHDDRIVGDAQLVKGVQQVSDDVVVIEHRVVVLGLPPSGAPDALRLGVGPEVHVSGVKPDEERCLSVVLALDEVDCGVAELLIAGLHPLLRQRAGVLDPLGAVAVRVGVQDASGTELLAELRVLRVVDVLRLFLGVEVIQVAEELVEAVRGGQELVTVTEVVLAELPGGVALRLERSRWSGLRPASRASRRADRPSSGRCDTGSAR